ncbi:MAG: LysM peptidoglycan-binding domain-containing protein, partial [Planctomycetes bacterium]|nr:LysM peptidoglycan-binding domain-containing protein [Planctomycetota bacterium]
RNAGPLRDAAFRPGPVSGGAGTGSVRSLLSPPDQPRRVPSGDGNLDVDDLGGDEPSPKIGDPPRSGGPGTDEPKTDEPKVEPPAPPAKRREYQVRKGDSFALIARRELGSERYTKQLQRLNPRADPAKLQIGQKLVLPNPADLTQGTSRGEQPRRGGVDAWRTYTISKGDTFEKIARVELGSKKRMIELRRLNPNVNPRKLQIGKQIKLPLK